MKFVLKKQLRPDHVNEPEYWSRLEEWLYFDEIKWQIMKEVLLMRYIKTKWKTADINTSNFVFFGAIIGAIIGLVAYVNNWL